MANVNDRNNIVIRFAGDSGDGMQLTGTLFSSLSAILGNEISTFPDFPAEIRAPRGTLGGVSSYQVHVGSGGIHTPGDSADVMVLMNPAALKVNAKDIKKGGIVLIDVDAFAPDDLKKAGFQTEVALEAFKELGVSDTVQIVPAPLSSLTEKSLEGFVEMDRKSVLRCKNMFALGLVCHLFSQPMEKAIHFLEEKFKEKPTVLKANTKVLVDGFNFGQNIGASISRFQVDKSDALTKGKYAIIDGNQAAALGLVAAAEKAGLQLYLGSYPITPATDVMQYLSYYKNVGVVVTQVEDEIGGITTSLGAAFAGNLAATNTSGPGMALKTEAIGLAVMAELPLVIINVMRAGPSTGMPTKTEQTDLSQALYGRNGECPVVVLAASTPDDCFHFAFMASKLALEHMTPVVLLTDAFIGLGSSLWNIPQVADLPEIKPPFVTPEMAGKVNAFSRDPETKVRFWSFPGMKGFVHRNGGLEKDINTGAISIEAANHEKMVRVRQEKVNYVANKIPLVQVEGDPAADTLIVGWGGTRGHLLAAVNEMNASGKKLALAHFNYINPLPKNTAEVLRRYKKVVVCELNMGQFATFLRASVPGVELQQYNKIQGQPFTVTELKEFFSKI